MNRRHFIETAGTLALAAAASPVSAFAAEKVVPTPARLPLWHGFNLTEKCVKERGTNPPFRESDFVWLEDWGFDFVRLPLSYLCWTAPEDIFKVRPDNELGDLDSVVELGRKHKVHVNLNLHRAPGYCVNPPKEPLDLWSDEKALDACAFNWGMLAKRFKGVPNEQLSFDLLNEPANVSETIYVRVVKRLVQAIHGEDPGRLIIADGLQWGREPVHGLVEAGVAQSTRGYDPMKLTHYKANWVRSEQWPEPSWPLESAGQKTIDKAFLQNDRIVPWKKLEQKGVGIHVGEWGVFNHTPHKVALAWMRDCLALWKEAGWGWSLWNFRGPFGILDSQRADVVYEDFHGSKLDRQMLTLLQGH